LPLSTISKGVPSFVRGRILTRAENLRGGSGKRSIMGDAVSIQPRGRRKKVTTMSVAKFVGWGEGMRSSSGVDKLKEDSGIGSR